MKTINYSAFQLPHKSTALVNGLQIQTQADDETGKMQFSIFRRRSSLSRDTIGNAANEQNIGLVLADDC